MKIQIEATPHITQLDGVECRAWRGITEDGVECVVLVHRIAVRLDADARRFDRELREKLPPGQPIELRHIL